MFHIMGESQARLCFVELARWQHRGQSLMSTIAYLQADNNVVSVVTTCSLVEKAVMSF